MVRETAGGGESYYRSQAVLQAALVAVTRRLDRCDAGLGRDRVNRTLDYGFGDRCFATKLCPLCWAAAVGLEPTTSRVKAGRSTD